MATVEEFASAQPLPLTDLLVNPADGAMYITVGGRRVQSGLYRVTYVGDESTAPRADPSLAANLNARLAGIGGSSAEGLPQSRVVPNSTAFGTPWGPRTAAFVTRLGRRLKSSLWASGRHGSRARAIQSSVLRA